MDIKEWIECAFIIINGLLVSIPLACKFYKVMKQLSKEKQWNVLMDILLELMKSAEKQFSEGAAKKAWVLNEIRVAAEKIDYEYDVVAEQKISDMIDKICEAAHELQKGVEQ